MIIELISIYCPQRCKYKLNIKSHIKQEYIRKMSNLQQLADCLMKTTSIKTEQRKLTENYLQNFSKNANFLDLLLSIPQMQDISSTLTQIAMAYCITYARNLILWKNQASINVAAQQMLTFIANTNVNFSHKEKVAIALTYLIENDQNNIISSAFIPNMTNTLELALQSPIKQINIQYLTIISEVLTCKASPNGGSNIQTYISHSFLCLSYLISKTLKYSFEVNVSDETLEKAFLLVAKMLKILKNYTKKFIFFSQNLIKVFCSSQFNEMVETVFQVSLPHNKLSSNLFYIPTHNCSTKLVQLFHASKSLMIFIFTQSLRAILNARSKQLQKQAKVTEQCPTLISNFVNSVNLLLQHIPYYKIDSRAMIKIIEEVFDFLVVTLRSCKFYSALLQIKSNLIFSCIMKTLAMAPQDYNNYYHDPQEFVQSFLEVIEVSSPSFGDPTKQGSQDNEVNDQALSTLKAHSGNLLKFYVKYIDGSLAQVIQYILNVLEQKINLQTSKNLMFVLLGILRDEVRDRPQLLNRIKAIIFNNLKDLQIPTNKVQEPYSTNCKNLDIEYTLTLILLSRYILLFQSESCDIQSSAKTDSNQHIYGNINHLSFTYASNILKHSQAEKVPKIISSQVILGLLKTEQGDFYSHQIIQLLNELLSIKQVNEKYLECIQLVLKQNDELFVNNYRSLIQTIEKVSALLLHQIHTHKSDQHLMLKLWHILEEIAQSKKLSALMAHSLRRVLQPFLNLINGQNDTSLQENVYSIMNKIINATTSIDQFDLQIFSILPKTFYIGKGKYGFSTSFQLLQSIIYYGSEALSSDLIITKNLILLSIQSINAQTVNSTPRNQSDCLQAVFIIQSLIISVGQIFNEQIWIAITRCLTNKIRKINVLYDFVKGCIISTLTLILSLAHQNFTLPDKEQLIKLILSQIQCLTYEWSRKLFSISLSNLILNYTLPFITPCFVQILDCLITLLKISNQSNEVKFQQNYCNSQYIHFQKLVALKINRYCYIDQFEHFKRTIMNISKINKSIIENAYAELPQTKKQFFRDVLNIRLVNNHQRAIYKLKYLHSNNNNAM